MKTHQSFIDSVKVAIMGILTFFRRERNPKIELFVAMLVIAFAALLRLNRVEWMLILLCIGIVIVLEMMNAALEQLCDLVDPNLNPKIKVIKDMSAGAVLIAAIMSVVVGLIIFLPKIFRLFF